jgi:hypothetical protein
MEQISFFLAKFKTLGLADALAKEVFIEIVEKILGIKLESRCVKLKNETFFVTAGPGIKSELFLKREKILAELSAALGTVKTRSIR